MNIVLPLEQIPTISISGTPGAGKSTAASLLAGRLNRGRTGQKVWYIESGFWYRALAYLHKTGKLYWDGKMDLNVVRNFDFVSFLCNGKNWADIQHWDMDLPTAWLARNLDLRAIIEEKQKPFTENHLAKIIVGPKSADLKFYLHTDSHTGAMRRVQFHSLLGFDGDINVVERLVDMRAEQDNVRKVASVRADKDGVISIDTTELSPHQIMEIMFEKVWETALSRQIALPAGPQIALV